MKNCRLCHSENLSSIIPLGDLPLANSFSALPEENPKKYNLEVMLCQDCNLAQLKDIVSPQELFSNYLYFSSNSETMLRSASQLTNRIMATLCSDSLIIEIASNDGYLLKNYSGSGFNVLGIEPALNIANYAIEQGIPTINDFFTQNLAEKIIGTHGKADIIHANNVFAHVPDINDFLKGIKTILKSDGKAIIEVPYFLDLIENLEFDTIYHEHVYYFTVQALLNAFSRHDLELFHIEKIKLHGGSLRLFIGNVGENIIDTDIKEFVALENAKGLSDLKTYQLFMTRLNQLKLSLKDILKELQQSNAQIAAYGASAKGTTLLNYFEMGHKEIQFVVDISIEKQGKYTPGTKLKVFDPSYLLKHGITHVLLLVWNFHEEIMRQQADFINQGGRFILPLPTAKVV